MKIVHLILTHSFAGSERYAIELANAQCEHHDVTMVLHRRAGEARPNALAHRLDPRVRIEWVSGWSLLAIFEARRRVEALAPDVAHAHLSGGCKALKGLRCHTLRVATLHIHYKPQQHAHLDALIALTPAQLAAIPEGLRARTVQIDNWTCANPVGQDKARDQRRAWGVPDDVWLLGALGRIEHSKGIEVIAEAVRPFLDDTKFRLVIVGGGRDFERIRRKIDPRIQMVGFQSQPDVCFAAFNCYVNAAYSEPFGLVFLEAMTQRLPIVATASTGALHLSLRHKFKIVPIGDVERLSCVLREEFVEGATSRDYDLSSYQIAVKNLEIVKFYEDQGGMALTGRE